MENTHGKLAGVWIMMYKFYVKAHLRLLTLYQCTQNNCWGLACFKQNNNRYSRASRTDSCFINGLPNKQEGLHFINLEHSENTSVSQDLYEPFSIYIHLGKFGAYTLASSSATNPHCLYRKFSTATHLQEKKCQADCSEVHDIHFTSKTAKDFQYNSILLEAIITISAID